MKLNQFGKSSQLGNSVFLAAIAALSLTLTACDRNKDTAATTTPGTAADRAMTNADNAANQAGGAVSDAAITAKVKTALIAEPGLSALKIDVDTSNGVVTLNGTIDNQANADRAKTVATNVSGVKSVNNKLSVKAS